MRLILASASPRRAELLRAAGYEFDVVVGDVDESIRDGEAPSAYVRRLAADKSAVAMRLVVSAMRSSDGPAEAGHHAHEDGPAEAGHYGRDDGPAEAGHYGRDEGPAKAGHYEGDEGPAEAGHYGRDDGPAEAGHYGRDEGPAKAGHYEGDEGPAKAGHYGRDDAIVLGADTTVVVDGEILAKPRDDADAAAMLRRLTGRAHDVLTGVSLRRGAFELGRVETTRVYFAPLADADIAWYVATGEGRDKAGAYAIQGVASRFIPRIEGSYSNVVGLPVACVRELLTAISGTPRDRSSPRRSGAG